MPGVAEDPWFYYTDIGSTNCCSGLSKVHYSHMGMSRTICYAVGILSARGSGYEGHV